MRNLEVFLAPHLSRKTLSTLVGASDLACFGFGATREARNGFNYGSNLVLTA